MSLVLIFCPGEGLTTETNFLCCLLRLLVCLIEAPCGSHQPKGQTDNQKQIRPLKVPIVQSPCLFHQRTRQQLLA